MEEKFKNIVEEYLNEVNNVCGKLINGLNSLENVCLRSKMDFLEYRAKTHKMEYEIDGISFRFHGKGCTAFNKEVFIDWDFGYRSRWCGIDPWKVATTLERNGYDNREYYNGDLIRSLCEQAVLEGVMFKQRDQYYFTIPADETFEPDFPEEFDTLIIEHFDTKWSIQRNKIVDRFIRKSKKVYNQIGKCDDKYILKFLLEGKEVYTIPYDDTGYPESAVKIMSDEIIRNLNK